MNGIQVEIKTRIQYDICGIGDMGCGKYRMSRDKELGI